MRFYPRPLRPLSGQGPALLPTRAAVARSTAQPRNIGKLQWTANRLYLTDMRLCDILGETFGLSHRSAFLPHHCSSDSNCLGLMRSSGRLELLSLYITRCVSLEQHSQVWRGGDSLSLRAFMSRKVVAGDVTTGGRALGSLSPSKRAGSAPTPGRLAKLD